MLTCDARLIGPRPNLDQTRFVAERITADIARAGVLVELADHRGARA